MIEALLSAALEWRDDIISVSNMYLNPWATSLLLMTGDELIIEYCLFVEETKALIQEESKQIPQSA